MLQNVVCRVRAKMVISFENESFLVFPVLRDFHKNSNRRFQFAKRFRVRKNTRIRFQRTTHFELFLCNVETCFGHKKKKTKRPRKTHFTRDFVVHIHRKNTRASFKGRIRYLRTSSVPSTLANCLIICKTAVQESNGIRSTH